MQNVWQIGIFFLLQTQYYSYAWLLEPLSHASYVLRKWETCPTYNEAETNVALEKSNEAICKLNNLSPDEQLRRLATITRKATDNAEDDYFATLAKQQVKELSCARNFVDTMTKSKPEALQIIARDVEKLRAAKQQLIMASSNVSNNPNIFPKLCPSTKAEISQNPLTESGAACREVIINRTAYDTILQAIPLANVPAMRAFLERYVHLPIGPIQQQFSEDLESKITEAYNLAKLQIQTESNKLLSTIENAGGAGFDRSARHALMSDPRIIEKIIASGGNNLDLQALACRANARYGEGADYLETNWALASFALSGGVGMALRAGSIGAKVAASAQAGRAAGLISLNSSRIIKASAFAVSATVNSVEAYSAANCFLHQKHALSAHSNETSSECMSAPTVEQLYEDDCVLTAALAAINFGVLIPFKDLGKKLKGVFSSERAASRTEQRAADITNTGGAKVGASYDHMLPKLPSEDLEMIRAKIQDLERGGVSADKIEQALAKAKNLCE